MISQGQLILLLVIIGFVWLTVGTALTAQGYVTSNKVMHIIGWVMVSPIIALVIGAVVVGIGVTWNSLA